MLEDRNEKKILVENDDPFFVRSLTDKQRSVLPNDSVFKVLS